MQAIGFLSRREHSRQELRAKLLDSLRKRARDDAALEATMEKAAQDLAEALRTQPSNGIDDAFAPPMPASVGSREASSQARRAPAATRDAPSALAGARVLDTKPARTALESLSLASGAPLSAALRASLLASEQHEPQQMFDAAVVTGGAVGVAAMPTEGRPMPPCDLRVAPVDAAPDDDLERTDPEAAVDQLLDWLAANNYLSETRFVESRVNARSRKQGALRIKMELSRHGLALEPEQAAALRETEFARAQALWQRKFGAVAADARERAKQARFLAARGFAADVVRRVVGGQDEL